MVSLETVTLLGTRGSIPVSGNSFMKYGGSTVSIMLQIGEELILIDGGSGLLSLSASVFEKYTRASLFITHPHFDHLLGIPISPIGFCPGYPITIYGRERNGEKVAQQIERLISPPLWPVSVNKLPAAFSFAAVQDDLTIGSVRVSSMEGDHPGGVTLFRFDSSAHSIVVATDCTYTDELMPSLIEFARDCDLLLCDGQYFDAEWATRSTFGHNTWRAAARLGALCGAAQTRILHHDPGHTDIQLDAAAAELKLEYPHCRFGYEREEIIL